MATEDARRLVMEVSDGALSLGESSLSGQLPITSAAVADALAQNGSGGPSSRVVAASRMLVKAADMQTSSASSEADDGRRPLLQSIADSCVATMRMP
jgi:hypothetical protein